MIEKITKNTPQEYVEKLSEECKKCGNCCSFGSGFILQEEIKKIAEFLDLTQKELKEKFLKEVEFFNTKQYRVKMEKNQNLPHGKCAFLLGNKTCAINKVKPLHCKISNCKDHGDEVQTWFMANYFLNSNDPESIRQYASYLKTGGRLLSGAKLEDLVPDKGTLKKILNFERLK
ncbi:hypothetical protein HOK51_02465 [Candidatus Woesearchaeota archaeon]|jgi:Fe-S-cluster containining protein|nr:hypothetical protein [Candidatus Woesearchaeota archaeon]MBT6518681.1 hypothetical protein [Candidatus Woesearchaeota archaeon]MBT7368870.1 hypothetical protein [Candidatus Woesearchaeota archaeon]